MLEVELLDEEDDDAELSRFLCCGEGGGDTERGFLLGGELLTVALIGARGSVFCVSAWKFFIPPKPESRPGGSCLLGGLRPRR